MSNILPLVSANDIKPTGVEFMQNTYNRSSVYLKRGDVVLRTVLLKTKIFASKDLWGFFSLQIFHFL